MIDLQEPPEPTAGKDTKKLNQMIIEIMKIKNEVVTDSREQKKR